MPWVGLLCFLAALRVFIYAGAFPFFNNVDEQAHLDLVVKYSEGRVPRSLNPFSSRAAFLIVRYASPEFVLNPQQQPGGVFPAPRWTQSSEENSAALEADAARVETVINHEASQSPLYYIVAALWAQVGQLLGMGGGMLLYWIRFLNVVLAAALVWIAYLVSTQVFPSSRSLRFGTLLLVAFIPQDTFYGVQSDVLSPVCFGLALLGIERLFRTEIPTTGVAVFTGLTLAATCLVKVSNLPLLGVAFLFCFFKVRQLARAGRLAPAVVPLGILAACVSIPILLWCGWNLKTYGDLAGTSAKIQILGWTLKSIPGWFQHPIFSFSGSFTFWNELIASFWRGEFLWHGRRITLAFVDYFYVVSTAVMIGFALISLIRRNSPLEPLSIRMLWFCFWCFCSTVVFLAWLSVTFDFGKCVYPSQAHPFFTSGRLCSVALIPFALIYIYGLERLLAWVKCGQSLIWVVLGIVLLMVVSEAAVSWSVFKSTYNWFHMP